MSLAVLVSAGAQGDQLGGLVVRQPDLDVFLAAGQAGEPQGLNRPGTGFRGSGDHVDGEYVAVRRAGLACELPVGEELVHAVGARR